MPHNVEQQLNRLAINTIINNFNGWLYSLALPEYMVPPGAEVRGSEAWCAWMNWTDRVDPKPKTLDYMHGGFSGYDDTEDHKAVLRALAEAQGPNSDLFTQLYREFYNDAVARLKSEVARNLRIVETCQGEEEALREVEYSRKTILRAVASCQKALDDYHVEVLLQKFAARKLARWFKRLPPPGVRVSETGTWIADDDIAPDRERAAFLIVNWWRATQQRLDDEHNDRVWREMHPVCQGCRDDQPNQLAHTGPGGCLEPPEERCHRCGGDAAGSDYAGYCSRACRYN